MNALDDGTQLNGPVGAVVLAAGSSTRMNGVDKMFATVAGRPLVYWSLAAFCETAAVHRIVLVLRADLLERGRSLILEHGWDEQVTVCAGGARRQDSVAAGLAALSGCAWALVHDGARPCITPDFITAALAAAQTTGAAVPGLPVTDTLKRVDDAGRVLATVDRAPLRGVQTPQAFRYAILTEAHRLAAGDVTDDAALIEALGVPVQVFPGLARNLKVTTADDLALAEFYLTAGRTE